MSNVQVSLSNPLHYIDQNGIHRKLYGIKQEAERYRLTLSGVSTGYLKTGPIYLPAATPDALQYLINDPTSFANYPGTSIIDNFESYPKLHFFKDGYVHDVYSAGLYVMSKIDNWSSYSGVYVSFGGIGILPILYERLQIMGLPFMAEYNTISIDRDLIIKYDFYYLNPDEYPQTPEYTITRVLPAGTSYSSQGQSESFHVSVYYLKITVTITDFGSFSYPAIYSPWYRSNDDKETNRFLIHLGG